MVVSCMFTFRSDPCTAISGGTAAAAVDDDDDDDDHAVIACMGLVWRRECGSWSL